MIRSSTTPIFSPLSLYTALPRIFFLALHPIATAFTSSTLTPIVVDPATCAPSRPAEPTTTSPANATAATPPSTALPFIAVSFLGVGCPRNASRSRPDYGRVRVPDTRKEHTRDKRPVDGNTPPSR